MFEALAGDAVAAAFAAAAARAGSVSAADGGADVAIAFAEFDAQVVTTPETLFGPAAVTAAGKVEVVKTSAVLWPGGNVMSWANSVNAAGWAFPFGGTVCCRGCGGTVRDRDTLSCCELGSDPAGMALAA